MSVRHHETLQNPAIDSPNLISRLVNVTICRNGSWADGPHEAVNSGWGDDAKTGVGGVSSWNEQPLTPTSWAGSKPKNTLNPGWVDGDLEPSSWVHAPKQASISPVYRLLLQHEHEPKLSL
jgi:hypothetical protein